jgi:hypothetical protein
LGILRRLFVSLLAPLRYPVLVNSPHDKPLDYRAIGLLVVAAIIFAIVLWRWGATIPWSAR